MAVGYIGAPIPRREDLRHLTGKGTFVHDLTLPGMAHLAVLRSQRAHARVRALHLSAARRMPGVLQVFAADDLGPVWREPPPFPPDPSLVGLGQPPLARDVVRFVGEPLACVVAESRYLAEDAVDAVTVELDPLPVLTDVEAAAESSTRIFGDRTSNVLARVHSVAGRGRDGLSEADHVVEARLRLPRVVAHPLEPRATLAQYDASRGLLTVWATTQGVHHLRHALAHVLGLAPEQIRVLAPDVGGGFGVKNRCYPEDILVAYAAMRLGRPVKWSGDRLEEFLATNQAREQVHQAALGVRADGTLVALVDRFLHDNGAYLVEGVVVPNLTLGALPGPYRVPHLEVEGLVVATNKVPNGPYRGAGAPEGTFVMERLMDLAADALGMDRVELRRRNLLTPDELPRATGATVFGAPVEITEGDFPATMALALERAGYPRLRQEQERARQAGRLLGIGVANYLELSAGTGFECARFSLSREGRVVIATGSGSQGQGHATTFAQIAADRLGVPLDLIDVVEADTGAIERGMGTFGSRSTVTAGNAVAKGAVAFAARLCALAADILEAPPDEVVLADGQLHVRGVPARGLSLGQLAKDPRSTDVAVEDLFDPGPSAKGMGTHVAVVEVDPETLAISLRTYAMVFDGGVLVNPLLVRGQMIGGAVQGIGPALYEALVVDEQGQPRNTSFLDYVLPGANEMPDFVVESFPFPAANNPEGFKGIGEGATIPAAAAVVAAVEDALAGRGIRLLEPPVTPVTLHRLLRGGGMGSSRTAKER